MFFQLEMTTANNSMREEMTESPSGDVHAGPQKGRRVRGRRLTVGIGIFFFIAAVAALTVSLVCKYIINNTHARTHARTHTHTHTHRVGLIKE